MVSTAQSLSEPAPKPSAAIPHWLRRRTTIETENNRAAITLGGEMALAGEPIITGTARVGAAVATTTGVWTVQFTCSERMIEIASMLMPFCLVIKC